MKQLLFEAEEYVLGRIDSSQLPMIAAQALARGIDSPALSELAGLSPGEVREAGDLFPIALAELGRPLRERHVVLWDRAAQTAHALLAGTRGIGDAIGEIAWLLCQAQHQLPDGRHNDLATNFELLLIDWDEHPASHHDTTIAAERASRRLLDVAETLGIPYV